MAIKFSKTFKDCEINNLPDPDKGIETGRFEIDYYGCWHEVKRKDGTTFWMIGEYPNSYWKAQLA